MSDISITLDNRVLCETELQGVAVRDLPRYRMAMYGIPIEVADVKGTYRFDWRGCSFNREFRGDDPAETLIMAVRQLSHYVDPKTKQLLF